MPTDPAPPREAVMWCVYGPDGRLRDQMGFFFTRQSAEKCVEELRGDSDWEGFEGLYAVRVRVVPVREGEG